MSEYELGNRLTKQITELQAELDESRAKNKQCICMFCHEVMPRPDDDEATATMLVDHAYNCKKHPVAKLQAEVKRLRDKEIANNNLISLLEKQVKRAEQALKENEK